MFAGVSSIYIYVYIYIYIFHRIANDPHTEGRVSRVRRGIRLLLPPVLF